MSIIDLRMPTAATGERDIPFYRYTHRTLKREVARIVAVASALETVANYQALAERLESFGRFARLHHVSEEVSLFARLATHEPVCSRSYALDHEVEVKLLEEALTLLALAQTSTDLAGLRNQVVLKVTLLQHQLMVHLRKEAELVTSAVFDRLATGEDREMYKDLIRSYAPHDFADNLAWVFTNSGREERLKCLFDVLDFAPDYLPIVAARLGEVLPPAELDALVAIYPELIALPLDPAHALR